MTWQPTATERAILRHVIQEKGADRQQIKAAEEFAEASAAISRFTNGDATLGEVADELADTDIMRQQLCEMTYGFDLLIAEQRAVKLATLAARFGFSA